MTLKLIYLDQLVGDKFTDMQAGIKANIPNNLLYKNDEEILKKSINSIKKIDL